MPVFQLEIPIRNRLLHLPVRAGCPKVILQIQAGGRLLREFSIELAEGQAVDWWAFYDVSAFQGQTVTLAAVGELPPAQAAWLAGAICQSDEMRAAGDLYREAYRPQFHFTPRRGWNNDPNGMVYAQGEWHLFYQHNPFGTGWGNMHWGHAVSADLVHWNELPEALYQRSLQDMAFSGGGLVDAAGSAGWVSGAGNPLVVAFTSTARGECLAYSLDRGRSLVEYPGNPVIAHQGRDPKIIWYEPGQHWVMVVYEDLLTPGVGIGKHGEGPGFGYAFYTSADLVHWHRRSFLPGWFECPELFEAPVEGRPGMTKWVLYGCLFNRLDSAYMVGSFDGMAFTPEMEPAPAHYGPAFYAAQNFSQAPGRRQVMVGWLKGAGYPGMPFSQGMSVPLELSLRPNPTGPAPYRLCFQPVAELERLYRPGRQPQADAGTTAPPAFALNRASLTEANALLAQLEPLELLDVQLELVADGPCAFYIGDAVVNWDPALGQVSFAGQTAPISRQAGRLELRALIDRSVTEIFANRGWTAFAAMTLFPPGGRKLRLEGAVKEVGLKIWPMHSSWGV